MKIAADDPCVPGDVRDKVAVAAVKQVGSRWSPQSRPACFRSVLVRKFLLFSSRLSQYPL